jgi:putative glutathione S-transferase
MGLLVSGEWVDRWYDTSASGGRFERQPSAFRKWVRRGDAEHPAEPGRYRLVVSHACPWAHRTLIVRALEGLEDAIPVTAVEPDMLANGWELAEGNALGVRYLHQLYRRANPRYTGRVTVPVLWDEVAGTIVSNESAEIIRMLDEELGREDGADLRPIELREEIDAVNDRVYTNVNNGVYRAGFATTQEAYDEAVRALFDTLAWLEQRLEDRRFLVGDRLTEADIRLFTTLVRFDVVYHTHFKCTQKRIQDHPRLWALTRRIYQMPEVKPTVRFDHIRRHYFYSHESINPHRVVPVMPDIDFDAPVE